MDFEKMYQRLNVAQKKAVDQIDGPVLVIAGPGTGKTQLLSARVANILKQTDTLAQNILCLTFTDNAAANMRDRLTKFIGQDSYNVCISTYHAFGAEIIGRFPEYFGQTRLQEAVDQLGKREIVAAIVEEMSYKNPLKQTRHHLGDLISTISEVKRALLSPEDLKEIANQNIKFLESATPEITQIFSSFTRMPSSVAKAIPLFEQVRTVIRDESANSENNKFNSLQSVALLQLEAALEAADSLGKTKPLTEWKNAWLAKNESNEFVLAGSLENKRMLALADVCSSYQTALESRGLYDFDDMIIRVITALEQHKDLKYSLQEQYQYLLLDEFQDTNAAQLKLVRLLTDNPVHEDRPNVLAVGDDDQAIYAFQGAEYSNMVDFYNLYKDVTVIPLTENYRSHNNILHTAHNVAEQISARLHHQFESITKTLTAANTALETAHIERREFLSEIAEYNWISSEIKKLIKKGAEPSEIAVLAPRHKYLEPLVPYLNEAGIAVQYEKRENILEAPIVQQIITMSRLVLALQNGDRHLEASLWPQVLSYPFWGIPTNKIWQLSWKINDSKETTNWAKNLLEEDGFKTIGTFFLTLANMTDNLTLEDALDYLTGSKALQTNEPDLPEITSPLKSFYLGEESLKHQPFAFYESLTQLTVLRQKLRDHQATRATSLKLSDLISFVDLYELADERMVHSSPYNQSVDAVQIMTVFKAKGLEFKYVFLPRCHDDVWGESSRGNSNKISLPKNLAPIRHAGANQDERLRIFFVAITRAKIGLYLSSFKYTFSGKQTKRLKYLNEQEDEDSVFKAQILPAESQTVTSDPNEAISVKELELNWQQSHLDGINKPDLRDLLEERLSNYQLSPTHLNSFVDLEYGGPQTFFFNTILRFPQGPTTDGQFGNAIHETLEWIQHQVSQLDKLPATQAVIDQFLKYLTAKKLDQAETQRLAERGKSALTTYLKQRGSIFKPTDKAEHNFKDEGVFVKSAHLAGKVDRIEVDKETKTITVVDYKTGKSYNKWASELKLHKYKQQLYCYKLLIEGSHSYHGYAVTEGRLEFIEPDENGTINTLSLTFDPNELERTSLLLDALFKRIKALDLPDVSEFDPSLSGTKKFEDWLLENNPKLS